MSEVEYCFGITQVDVRQSNFSAFINRVFLLRILLKVKIAHTFSTWLQILLGPSRISRGPAWCYSEFRHWELTVVSFVFPPPRSNMSCTVKWAPLSSCVRSVLRTTRMWRLSPAAIWCAPPASLPGRYEMWVDGRGCWVGWPLHVQTHVT